MTTTRCERHGQIEVGVIEHEGREFSALGASVVGNSVTGYLRNDDSQRVLTTWCGQIMLDCRSEVIERYWSDSLALMFRLTKRRFIVGYALAENGMLFRGELVTDSDEDDARRHACYLAEFFADLDAEDELEAC